VVAKAIMRRMLDTGAEHVWLDAKAFGEDTWRRRFPTILATCRSHGIDPVTELIPVAPACHYASGGVATDLDGHASVPGLFACGEVACSGVHGANRLASNSLLEGLVFARRIAARLRDRLPPARDPDTDTRVAGLVPADARAILQQTMTDRAGVLRSAAGLAEAADRISALAEQPGDAPDTAAWETTNLVTVGAAVVAAARTRQETRGSHWREDFPDTDDGAWFGHLDVTQAKGALRLDYRPAARPPVAATTGAVS
jgi:L-aspartate oxidase